MLHSMLASHQTFLMLNFYTTYMSFYLTSYVTDMNYIKTHYRLGPSHLIISVLFTARVQNWYRVKKLIICCDLIIWHFLLRNWSFSRYFRYFHVFILFNDPWIVSCSLENCHEITFLLYLFWCLFSFVLFCFGFFFAKPSDSLRLLSWFSSSNPSAK